MSAAGPPKKVLAALEKVFAAEIVGRLPFQSKATIYRDLLAAGLVAWMERKVGAGPLAVIVSGYELTHSGRYLYCQSCDDEDGWQVRAGPEDPQSCATFEAAERLAKKRLRDGAHPVEITLDGHTVAHVRLDALDRVWVDVVDASVA